MAGPRPTAGWAFPGVDTGFDACRYRIYHPRVNYLLYFLIGLGFGFGDWYFVQALQERRQLLAEGLPLAAQFLTAVNFLVWLLPLALVVMHSARRYKPCWQSGLAAALVWGSAMLAYYGWGAYLMAGGNLPGWSHLNRHLEGPHEYQGLVWSTVRSVMGAEFKDWIVFAIPAGFLIGLLLCALIRFEENRRGGNRAR